MPQQAYRDQMAAAGSMAVEAGDHLHIRPNFPAHVVPSYCVPVGAQNIPCPLLGLVDMRGSSTVPGIVAISSTSVTHHNNCIMLYEVSPIATCSSLLLSHFLIQSMFLFHSI